MDTIISANEEILDFVRKIGKDSSLEDCERKIAEQQNAQPLMEQNRLNAKEV